MHKQTGILAGTLLALMLAAPTGAAAQQAQKLAATFNERYPTDQLPTRQPVAPLPTQPPAEQAPIQPPAEQKPAPVPTPSPPEQTGARPLEQSPTQAPAERAVAHPPRPPEAAQARDVQTTSTQRRYSETGVRATRTAGARRAPSRVVVVPRSFLDAGTEVLPGERKFLDYAFPPTHLPMDVVTNTGGRVGWHNSPLPGPFFPTTN